MSDPPPAAAPGLVLSGASMELVGTAPPTPVTLTIAPPGLIVRRDDGALMEVPWSAVSDARCGEAALLPDGTDGVAVAAVVAGRFVRWVVPADQMPPERATAINHLLDVRLRVPVASPASPAPSAPVVAVAAPAADPVAPPFAPPFATPVPAPALVATPTPSAAELSSNGAAGADSTPRPVIVAVPLPPEPPITSEPPIPLDPLPVWPVVPVFDERPALPAEPELRSQPELPVEPGLQVHPTLHDRSIEPTGSDVSPSETVAPLVDPTPSGALPRLAPIGGWERAAPAVPAYERRHRQVVRFLWVVVVVLVVAAIVVLVVGLTAPSPAPEQPVSPAIGKARTLAGSVRITVADFPSGWSASPTGTSPLDTLLGAGDGAGLAPGTHPSRATSSRFATCLRRPESSDTLVGPAGARPLAHATSPLFDGPSDTPAGVSSLSSVYATATEVSQAAAELRVAAFDQCFAATVGQELVRGAESVPSDAGASFGALESSALSLPERSSVRAAGVELSLPVTFSGGKATVDIGFAFVAGGRIESTLVSYSTSGEFPLAVTRSLTADIERRIAAAGNR